jgi:hypothetical protein
MKICGYQPNRLMSNATVCLQALAVSALAVIFMNSVVAGDDDTYAIGLWGDLPYSDIQAKAVSNLIDDMNSQNLAFTVHDGDLKSGGSECTDAVYLNALDYFNSLEAPAMFTPGDNDWTDCDRIAGYSSLAQLEKERHLFFSTPFSLGQHSLRQEVQRTPYVENRRWSLRGVTYATLNIQSSCNNLCNVNPDELEYKARNDANIAWLKDTLKKQKTAMLQRLC